MQVNVSVNFKARSKKAAEETIAAWKLHKGATVNVSLIDALPLSRADEDGTLVEVVPPEPLDDPTAE